MDLLIAVCIILVLIFINSLLTSVLYNSYFDTLDKIDFNDLNTGDVLLFKQCLTCKKTNNVLNNGWLMTYAWFFNSIRKAAVGCNYTHVAIVLNINNNPYIVHIDSGTMYDVINQKDYTQKITTTSLQHVNIRGGPVHVFRYIGKPLPDAHSLISDTECVKYPNTLDLIKNNAFKLNRNTLNTMACTDFVEYVWYKYNIINTKPSKNATLFDIFTHVKNNKNYNRTPLVVKNKCYLERHY